MDNYTHIDMPDHIRALTLSLITRRHQEQANANPFSTDTFTADTSTATAKSHIQWNPCLISKSSRRMPPRATTTQLKTTILRNTNTLGQPSDIRHQQQLQASDLTEPKSQKSDSSCDTGIRSRGYQRFRKDDGECKTRDKDAQLAFGEMYRNGDGLPQTYYQEMIWYLKAAKQGLADAQLAISLLYQSGVGVSGQARAPVNSIITSKAWPKSISER